MSVCLSLGACAQVGGGTGGGTGLLSVLSDEGAGHSNVPASGTPHEALTYWADRHAKDPRNLESALGHARALKATGNNNRALAVLKQASVFHPRDKDLASEYGRLALSAGQVSLAKKYLEVADDPAAPDWRVIMARGTAMAKEGNYSEATRFFERAQKFAPDHPSLLSNLALAYTMSGQPARGERLLRQAVKGPEVSPKIRQNLALVLGLQGKYKEATRMGSLDLTPDKAHANAELIRTIVDRRLASNGTNSKVAPPQEAWHTPDEAEPAPKKSKPRVIRTVARAKTKKKTTPKKSAGIYLKPTAH